LGFCSSRIINSLQGVGQRREKTKSGGVEDQIGEDKTWLRHDCIAELPEDAAVRMGVTRWAGGFEVPRTGTPRIEEKQQRGDRRHLHLHGAATTGKYGECSYHGERC
jgi:hypothetical protein